MTVPKTVPRPSPPLVLLALALASGCSGEDYASNYQLTLVPRTLGGQDPFAGDPAVKLFVEHEDRRREVFSLGNAVSDRVQKATFPPILAGSILGLIVEEPGGPENEYNPELLLAYGEVDIEEDLTNESQELELEIMLVEVYSPGRMAALGEAKQTVFGGAALVRGGDTYLFGGVQAWADDPVQGLAGLGTDRVSWMTDTDQGDWTFERLESTMCDTVCAFTTTLVEAEGRELVFMAGGRRNWNAVDVDNQQSDMLCLFDPETQEVEWGDRPSHAKLPTPRSGHRALKLADGKVLLYGGYTSSDRGRVSTFEVFDPTQREIVLSGALDIGSVGMAGASLGDQGALLCGGGLYGGDTMEPSDRCNIVSLTGKVEVAPALPEPLWNHAMVELPDGGVLAAGGNLQSVLAVDDGAEATDRAWVFDGSGWDEVAPLNEARANFEMLPTPGGDVVVVGGTLEGGALYPDVDTPILCTEVFEPDSLSFSTDNGSCTEAGSAAFPTIARHPIEGAFVLEGVTALSGFRYETGSSFGMLGFGPDL